jgi:hypothetical protein
MNPKPRFQFSIAELLGAAVLAAVACGLLRLAFAWPGTVNWGPSCLVVIAATSAVAAIGCLAHRPYRCAVIGLALAVTYACGMFTFFWIYGAG